MKILAGVMGAEAHILNGIQQQSRETWIRDFHRIGDYRFFIGAGDVPLQDDEVRVDCPDDKAHILYKTVEILKYSLRNGYDMTLKLDTDTFCNVDLLSRENYEGYDYVGAPVGTLGEYYAGTEAFAFIQGSASWLSRKAAEIVVDKAIPNMLQSLQPFFRYNGLICPYPHSEDLWIGQVLTPYIRTGEIKALADHRYSNGALTFHYALTDKGERFKNWMHRLYESKFSLERMAKIHRERNE